MRRSQLLWLAVMAVWMTAIWNYWFVSVSVLPTTVIRPISPSVVIGVTAADEVVTAAPSEGVNGRHRPRGPVEFWRLSNGQLSRSLDLAGGFEKPDLLGRDLLKIDKDGRCQLYDATTLTLVETLPEGTGRVFSTGAGASVVGFIQQGRLTVRDIRAGCDLWTREGVRSAYSQSGFVLALESADRKNLAHAILDAETGERITRFDHLGPVFLLSADEQSQYVVIQLVDRQQVLCRSATGERLWSAESNETLAGFTKNGEGVVVFQRNAPQGHSTGVRRCIDGEWIERPKVRPMPVTGTHRATSNTRYTFVAGEFSRWPAWLFRGRNWLQGKIAYRLPAPPMVPRYQLLDSRTGAIIADFGDPPALNAFPERWLKDHRGVLIERDGHLHYFEIPPRRDWAWLIRWAALPPAGLLALTAGWRRLRRRFRRPQAAMTSVVSDG